MSGSLDEIERKLADHAPLGEGDVDTLFDVENLLTLSALADESRRRKTGDVVTFVRVAEVAVDALDGSAIPVAAGEIRIVGTPVDFGLAFRAVVGAWSRAGGRPVSGFSLADLEALTGGDYHWLARELSRLKEGGLEFVAEAPVDQLQDAARAFGAIEESGLAVTRLTVTRAGEHEGASLVRRLRTLSAFLHLARAVAPLPRVVDAVAPTTGYDDVRLVAVTRLVMSDVDRVQVDWALYGPKLAQVALLCGANDIDAVAPTDQEDQGPRRAVVEEVRRNIRGASLTPVERDGRFVVRDLEGGRRDSGTGERGNGGTR